MPARQDVKAQVGNGETLAFQVTTSAGTGYDISDKPLRFVVKRYQTDPDEDAVVDIATGNSAIRLVEGGVEGKGEVDFQLSAGWRYWWRLDVTVAGKPSTALYGWLLGEDT